MVSKKVGGGYCCSCDGQRTICFDRQKGKTDSVHGMSVPTKLVCVPLSSAGDDRPNEKRASRRDVSSFFFFFFPRVVTGERVRWRGNGDLKDTMSAASMVFSSGLGQLERLIA